MKNKEILKRVDKAITELISIKVALTESEQTEAFEPKECAKTDYNRKSAITIINHLSTLRIKHKMSSKHLHTTTARIKSVTGRVKESSLEDAKKVIDTRFIEWVNDDKRKQYLTIETMFRPSNYFKYLDDADRILKTVPKSFTDNPTGAAVGSWTD